MEQGVAKQFPEGIEGHNVHLMSDNGCQPTSVSFMKACRSLNIEQAFTCYNNPKGNADTERFMRTFKEELVWSRDWQDPFEFAQAATKWFETYNREYLHSSLEYRTPEAFEKQFYDERREQKPLTLVA